MPAPRPHASSALPYFSGPGPRVLAHRGLHTDASENTLGAFRKALDAGATYLELDVHGSRDGVAVVSHDPDLSRVAGRDSTVSAMTMDELRAIDLGHGEGFASLQDVLTAFPAARFNIDIKSASAVSPAAYAILLAGASDRVLIASFSERRRAAVARRLPGVATSASSPRVALAVLAAKAGVPMVVASALRGMHAIQIPARVRGMAVATPRVISAMHRAGVEVHIWTVNDRAEMERLLELGVDGLVTDRADIAVEVVAERVHPDARF